MRIALVTDSFAPERTPDAHRTRRVAEELLKLGHEVMIVTEGRGQATFRSAPVFRASRLTPASAIAASVRLNAPDIVHLLGDPSSRLVHKMAGVCAKLGLPTVAPNLASWEPGTDLDHYHPGLRDELLHQRWSRTAATRGNIAHEPAFVVGYVGPLQKKKVVARLRAIAHLSGVRLVAVGDGPGDQQLRAAGAKVLPRANTLEEARLIASFDVLVQPRKKDNYVPAVHHALACGKPIIGLAPIDIVNHERNGLLVAPERGSHHLCAAVCDLRDDEALRIRLAGQARASVADRDWTDAVAELVEDHYLYALGRDQLASA